MANRYGPYQCRVAPNGRVILIVKAGPDPVISCNAGLFRRNPTPPPEFHTIRNPFWNPARVTSNVFPPVEESVADAGQLLAGCRLMVAISMAVLAPNPDPNHEYTATIAIRQERIPRPLVGPEAPRGFIHVRLKAAELTSWHVYAIDFEVAQ